MAAGVSDRVWSIEDIVSLAKIGRPHDEPKLSQIAHFAVEAILTRIVAPLSLSLCLLLPFPVYAGSEATMTTSRLLASSSISIRRPLTKWEQSRVSLMQTRMAPQRQRDSLVNGALIGAAIGAGYGFFVLAKTNGDLGPGKKLSLVPMSAGIGAGVGLLIDYLQR
jgi:hypothetical protein